jgi:hypothetical protein
MPAVGKLYGDAPPYGYPTAANLRLFKLLPTALHWYVGHSFSFFMEHTSSLSICPSSSPLTNVPNGFSRLVGVYNLQIFDDSSAWHALLNICLHVYFGI